MAKGKVLLNAIASGLAAPTNSAAGIAAATASPAVSYQIGQYFKGLAQNNSDGQLTAQQETAHILAHGILGAATSAAGGNNALAGALSAGGAEAAAPIISHYLYGEKDGSQLTAEQKETVVAITGLLGTTVGAVTGNMAANAVQGSLNAENAVENNYLTSKQLIEVDKAYHECGSNEVCKQNVIDSAKILSQSQDIQLVLAKAKCFFQKCDDLENLNREWVKFIGIHNVVKELRKYYPNASHQELLNAAKIYASEADNSYNQGTTRFIVGALSDSPALGLVGKQVSAGTRGIANLWKYRINPNVNINGVTYSVPLVTLHPNKVTVYRVEGVPNTRLLIDADGMVKIQGNTSLYLNFGDRKRAIEYLEQKVQQNLPNAQVKSFVVPKSVLTDLSNRAIPEKLIRELDPHKLQPVIADPTKAKNQFGIRPHDLEKIENQIIKGSGKNGK